MFVRRVRQKIRNIFFAGLMVTVPTMISFFLLRFLVQYIDQVSAPFAKRFFNTSIPGIGFSVTILLVFLIGFLGTNMLGRKLVATGEWLLSKIPLVRSIYHSAKQVIHTVAFGTEKAFKQVVIVPFPHKDMYVIGLLTREVSPAIAAYAASQPAQPGEDPTGDQLVNVFIPSTPNVAAGLVVMFPQREIIPIDMPVDESFTFILTGGLLTPKKKEKLPEVERKPEEWDLFLH